MSTQFPNLFSPIEIGNCTVRNRICCSAHADALAEDGMPTERTVRASTFAIVRGLLAIPWAARTMSSKSLGTASPCHGTSGGSGSDASGGCGGQLAPNARYVDTGAFSFDCGLGGTFVQHEIVLHRLDDGATIAAVRDCRRGRTLCVLIRAASSSC